MASSLIIDNFLLQDIGACLSNGLTKESASELVINKSNDNHSAIDVPYAGVQIEALLELLVNIVLRDSLIFDEDFTYTWAEHEDRFSGILKPGLARPLSFRIHEDKLKAPRQFVVDQLCITSSLREAQKRNVESWAAYKQADDPYLSNVIWGTAGMLSRSHVFEALYSAHPLRKRVMEQTILTTPGQDIVADVLEWMSAERLRIFQVKNQSAIKETAMIVLPPIVIDIIEESRDVKDLIPVAYQLRDKYAAMREWLKSIQTAVESEDPKKITKYKKTLDAVSKDIDQAVGSTNTGQISLNIGFGFPSLSISMGTVDGVMKNFGMRATLNNQIFTTRGEKSIKKLLRMFDEESSSLGFTVQEYLRVKR